MLKSFRHVKYKVGRIATLLLLTVITQNALGAVSIYFAAHQDDWQLFMGVNAYGDMKVIQTDPTVKVAIFHITAGDAGKGAPPYNYVVAREECAMNSIRFATSAGIGPMAVTTHHITVLGHHIMYKQYGSVYSFFLRLPDGGCGNPDGCLHLGSLAQLYTAGVIPRLPAVDGSTAYYSWYDLVSTVQKIVEQFEVYNNSVDPGSKLWVNYPGIEPGENDGDHRDHRQTGILAKDATWALCPHYVSFRDYVTSTLPPNLSNDAIANESALFGACTLGLLDHGFGSSWEGDHKDWLERNYYRSWDRDDCNSPLEVTVDHQLYDNLFGKGSGKRKTVANITRKNSVDIRIYQNPTSGNINVMPLNSSESITQLDILDVMGCKNLKTIPGKNVINISELPTGLYFLKIQTKDGLKMIKKIAKQ